MAKAITRVHPVHLVSADSAPGGHHPQTKPIDLDCESADRLTPFTSLSPVIIIT